MAGFYANQQALTCRILQNQSNLHLSANYSRRLRVYRKPEITKNVFPFWREYQAPYTRGHEIRLFLVFSPVRSVDLEENGALALGVVLARGRIAKILVLVVGVVVMHISVEHHTRVRDADLPTVFGSAIGKRQCRRGGLGPRIGGGTTGGTTGIHDIALRVNHQGGGH